MSSRPQRGDLAGAQPQPRQQRSASRNRATRPGRYGHTRPAAPGPALAARPRGSSVLRLRDLRHRLDQAGRGQPLHMPVPQQRPHRRRRPLQRLRPQSPRLTDQKPPHLTRGQPTQVGAVSNGLLDEPGDQIDIPACTGGTQPTLDQQIDPEPARSKTSLAVCGGVAAASAGRTPSPRR